MSNKIVDLTGEFSDKEVETYKLLTDSQKQEKILTAKVIGCIPNANEINPEKKYFITAIFRDWQVLIPCMKMGFNTEGLTDKAGNKLSGHDLGEYYKSNMRKMIGAEIDFCVYKNPLSINSATRQVVGDRSLAMERKRNSNFFKQDKNGKSKMERAFEANESVEARVVTIASSVIWVEIYGYLGKVLARDASWRYTENLHDVASVGDKVRVKFTELNIDRESKTIDAKLSIKAAYPNMQKENMKKYRPDSVLAGKITGSISGGYFVQVGDLNNGIDVFCKKINCVDIPHTGDIVAIKLSIFDEDKGRVFGSIESVIEKRYRGYVA